jgi:hypothetical protein
MTSLSFSKSERYNMKREHLITNSQHLVVFQEKNIRRTLNNNEW